VTCVGCCGPRRRNRLSPSPAVSKPNEPTADSWPLSRREPLRWIYLDVLDKAARRRVSRRAGQTPYEFACTLSQAAPEATADVNDLTRQFVDVRYSTHEVVAARVSWARRIAARISRLWN